MCSFRVWFLIMSVATVAAADKPFWKTLPSALWTQARRTLNLSSTFGSQINLAATPYDRVMSQPVFQVTTSWGSPYLTYASLENEDESQATADKLDFATKSIGFSQTKAMPIALFFLDPDDAIEMHEQMKQMRHMKKADMRITSTTLTKALRQASNLGNGLPTGSPIDPLDGNLKSMSDGGSLRYKLVPPRRQLYYAARCVGRERVGCFSDNRVEDAQAALAGPSAMSKMKTNLRREASGQKGERVKKATPLQMQYKCMEGWSGIPVFYTPQMRRVFPKVKQLTSGIKQETPFFFSYEDMMEGWDRMRKRSKNKNIPTKPTSVEVYNLFDVLTAMDRDEWNQKQKSQQWRKDPLGAVRERFSPKKESGLESITFVPASNSVHYKEFISAKGNGKARLRPMR